MRQSVDLDDDDPGLIGALHVCPSSDQGSDEGPVIGLVLAESDGGADRGEDEPEHERDQQRGQDPTGDIDARDDRIQQHDRRRLDDDGQDREQDHGSAGDERQQDRADEQVERRQEQHRGKPGPDVVDLQLWQEPRGQPERDHADDQRQHRASEERPTAESPMPQQCDLRAVEVLQEPHVLHRVLLAADRTIGAAYPWKAGYITPIGCRIPRNGWIPPQETPSTDAVPP